ncbi:hypothetical protein BDR05DRAFT_977282 [Suillus weaverae]|nr:hypothetical protein BDR05DRAFT_977282 [Suillus weaverae]
MSSEDHQLVENMIIDYGMDIESIPYTVPPEEEGIELSHAGGEHEAFEGLTGQITLIYHGYIGCTPLYPTAAILLHTLATYLQVKSLYFLHDTNYQPYLNAQFSATYNIYLEILHHIKQRHRAALNHDTPNWHMLNSCPACFYKLEDKPALEFDWLVLIDGNNSLKHWDSSIYGSNPCIDSRKAHSDYWLDTCDVDRHYPSIQLCQLMAQWWSRDLKKKMFSVFDKSGIFIAVCHHRFVVLACDMIWSGELVKYLLAIIDKLLTIYGKNSGCAYDIGCTFSKTLTNSSLDLHLMVGTFHRHTHNRKYQLDWHPMYIPRTRHTEGKGCEHVFS